MPSFPNMFNSYGDDVPPNNHHGFVPIQMNHNSNLVQSMLITSDQTNYGDLFSSSRYPFTHHYQNPHLSSSSFGFNNSLMMRRNIDPGFVMPQVSRVSNIFPLENNPNFTQISFTETITNRYSAIVPTNIIPNFQNDFERVMDSRTNILNPTIHTPNFHEQQCEILNPKPLNVIFPQQNSLYPQHLNMFTSSSSHHSDQYVSQVDSQLFKKSPKRTKSFEEAMSFLNSEDDEKSEGDHYDGRTHSKPCEKYGPYTCPKCDGVFDTSQKFAAHMSSHYKNETNEEREKRFRARNKKKYRKLNNEVHQESEKIKSEDGDNSGGPGEANDVEASQHPVVVKEEHV